MFHQQELAKRSGQERLDMVSTLRHQYFEIHLGSKPRLHRVYRVLQRGQR
ncbi:MAG: hypothetical protein MUF01_13825 [Bryobacterales bacterium]|nr:hypothetical protein [Bryobacterales bacterium]